MFVHLHTQSHYSFLEGLPSPADLAQYAARNKMPAVALTDRGGLSGAIEFIRACRQENIHPILGMILPIEPPDNFPVLAARSSGESRSPDSVVLLAMDSLGWTSLCRLSSALLNDAGPSLPLKRLAQDTDGLICLTGGRQGFAWNLAAGRQDGTAREALRILQNIFPGRLYVELQIHTPEDRSVCLRLASLAHRLRIPTVATQAVYYLEPGQAEIQRLATAIRLNLHLSNLPEEAAAPPGAHFRTA